MSRRVFFPYPQLNSHGWTPSIARMNKKSSTPRHVNVHRIGYSKKVTARVLFLEISRYLDRVIMGLAICF
jgi:hypothetical protein